MDTFILFIYLFILYTDIFARRKCMWLDSSQI